LGAEGERPEGRKGEREGEGEGGTGLAGDAELAAEAGGQGVVLPGGEAPGGGVLRTRNDDEITLRKLGGGKRGGKERWAPGGRAAGDAGMANIPSLSLAYNKEDGRFRCAEKSRGLGADHPPPPLQHRDHT